MWYIGVGLEIVSTMSGTVGKQLIRLSELRKQTSPRFSKVAFTTGLLVNTLVGPLLDIGAYSFAPQSLVAPFGGLDIVWNALLAPYVLQETLTYGRVVGCLLITLGTCLAGGFGNHSDPEYTVEYLEDTLVNIRVLVYLCVFVVWYIFNTQVLMRRPAGSAIRGISLGCTAGTIAGNMFCIKAAIELIEHSIEKGDGNVWVHWLPYVMLVGAIFFALSNVVYMTQGLKEYEALFMVTIYEGSMIVSGCMSGAIVLLDMRGIESWRVVFYGLSVVLLIFGMYVIFDQERRSRSSLVAGTASIKDAPPSPKVLDELLQPGTPTGRKYIHAACIPGDGPSLLSFTPRKLERTTSDPQLYATKASCSNSSSELHLCRRSISDSDTYMGSSPPSKELRQETQQDMEGCVEELTTSRSAPALLPVAEVAVIVQPEVLASPRSDQGVNDSWCCRPRA